MVGLASVVFVSLYGQSRVFYSMARDGFLPPTFSKVHTKFRTPHRGTIITGFFAALLAAAFPLDILAELVSVGTLLAFVAVCGGIMILRITTPKGEAFVPDTGCLVCSPRRRRDLRPHDGKPVPVVAGHRQPSRALDGARNGHLLCLRRLACRAFQMEGREQRVIRRYWAG